tara:strand:- start:1431 stop:2243 length:813 start_codon:yes stop_codon:yes gene_type:complete
MKIVSFGDSFVLGSEIANNDNGSKGWPGLIASRLDVGYSTSAVVGCGNDHITQQIYTYCNQNNTKDCLFVINWTWTMRWDIYIQSAKSWANIGPTCVPGKLKNILEHQQAEDLIDFYKNNISENVTWNLFRSLQAIYSVQCYMRNHNIRNVQTYMDPILFEKGLAYESPLEHYNVYKDPTWPDCKTLEDLELLPDNIKDEINQDKVQQEFPAYIQHLQSLIKSDLRTWDGMTFLEWSKHKDFEITELLHPLLPAHESAADLWIDTYKELL